MHSVNKLLILLSAILLATLSIAAPALEAQTPSVIFRRAEYKPVVCGRKLFHAQVKYSKKAIQTAYEELVRLMNKEEKDKPVSDEGKHYPKPFYVGTSTMRSVQVTRKLMNIKDCEPDQNGAAYLEFPLMEKKYTGGDQGLDRVLAIVYGNQRRGYSDPLYCMAMTHRDTVDDLDAADTDDEAQECS